MFGVVFLKKENSVTDVSVPLRDGGRKPNGDKGLVVFVSEDERIM